MGMGRTFRVESGGKVHAGWIHASFDESRCHVVLRISDSLRDFRRPTPHSLTTLMYRLVALLSH